MKNNPGYCQCGCGKLVPIAKQTRSCIGHIKGQPIRFMLGHNMQGCNGSNHPRWKGGKSLHSEGYVQIWKPDHPRANNPNGYVREHILIAEEVLGKPLPDGAIVHHVDGNGLDNRKENLVICQNQSYHLLLHRRMRALKACGHASWRKCHFCKEYDNPENLSISGDTIYHKKCNAEYQRLRYKKTITNGAK